MGSPYIQPLYVYDADWLKPRHLSIYLSISLSLPLIVDLVCLAVCMISHPFKIHAMQDSYVDVYNGEDPNSDCTEWDLQPVLVSAD